MISYIFENVSLRKGLFLSAMLFLSIITACKDEGSVVPQFTTGVLSFSDLVVEAKSATVKGDTVLTAGTSRNLFGKLNDQPFGLSTAEFYSQINLSSTSLSIPDEVTFDSAVLFLAYDKFYGYDYDQEVNVYELTESLDPEKSYYSNNTVTANETPIGTARIQVENNDTISDSTYILRIPIDKSLADRIKAEGNFANQDAWLDFFKGIRVAGNENEVPGEAGEGAIIYFNLQSTKTKLSLYYTNGDGTFSEDFIVESGSARFSHFENIYSTSLEGLLEKDDEEYNYIFAMGGSRTKIYFPKLDSISASLGTIAINKAQLIIPYEDSDISEYETPDRNIIITKDADGAFELPIDFYKGGQDFFGGRRDQVNMQYAFILSSTIHEMIKNGDFDKELYLSISGNAVTANRLKLNSGSNSKRKIFLILTYTKSG